VASITGGVVGGVALLVGAATCALCFFRRRMRRTRLTSAGEDVMDGGAHPFRSEEDMPPPDYQRVFPSVGVSLLSRTGRARSRLLNLKGRRTNIERGDRPDHRPPEILATAGNDATQQPSRDNDNLVELRHANDASILAWKGRQPAAVAVEKKIPGDPVSSHDELQEEPYKA
jgi:hypothetical protein